ncbi:MAG: hypothetical protein M5R40_17315 [Anaerolineae bacterium]|nr:hypothetical protein [Anaerolineae bacterium]
MRRWLVGLRAASMVLLVMIVAGAVPSQGPAALAQGGGTIGYGSKVLGMISADLTQVIYSFNGATGDLVQVHAKSWVGTLDPQVTLLGPDGQTVADSARSPFAVESRDAHLARFLPQTGTYLLLVSAENGTTGQFLLTLQGRAPVPATTLVYGEAVDVTVLQIPSHSTTSLTPWTARPR